MKILITGASGFVGKNLCLRLSQSGHQPIPISRDLSPFEECDAIIHLAGEPIANERWSPEKKRRVFDSRVRGSENLIQKIEALLGTKPSVIISASAIGYYGDRGDEILTESSLPGTGFLAEVCKEWEKQTIGHRLESTRQVAMRFGVVLGHGGALEKMLPPFRAGVGGPLGNGKQWMSWIHIDDLTAMIEFVLDVGSVSGAINAVAPNPITNHRFSETLAETLGKKSWMPVPAFALKALLGERAQLLLMSQRVVPEAILKQGFKFEYPDLASALRQVLA